MVVVPWHMPMYGALKGTVHSHDSAGSCCASWGGRATDWRLWGGVAGT